MDQGDEASGDAARWTPLEADPSTGEDEGGDELVEDRNTHDDLAAGLLLDLAAAAEPSTSMAKETWIGSHLNLTVKGKKRIQRDETRVRPPGRVTKLLDGHWPAIRMPDVLSAMESEDCLVLFANARYPAELGDDKLAANVHKLLNFHFAHHDTSSAKGLLDKMLALVNGIDRNGSPDTGVKAPPEASVLASFLKRHHGVQLKRSADELLLNSNSSDGLYARPTRTSSATEDGVTKAGSTVAGDGAGGRSEGASGEGPGEGSDAHPSRKTRQKPSERRRFTGASSGFAG